MNRAGIGLHTARLLQGILGQTSMIDCLLFRMEG